MQTEEGSEPQKSGYDGGFEEIEHTADWALSIRGRDLRQLLINAARGMNSLLVSETESISIEREEQLELDAFDAESLLVSWLSELAYWVEMERVIFCKFDLIQVTPTYVQAVVRGGYVADLKKHIKAVTYHNLEIIETAEGLTATVVFDV